ncbi:MAG: HD domain-containing phosphohydrolase [Planctomycetota bacterium]
MSRNVLIADSNKERLVALSEAVTQRGWEVTRVELGSECVEHAVLKLPDIVVIDTNLTDVDGYEVCRRIKKEPGCETLFVVLISGECSGDDRIRAYELGATDFFMRPFREDEFLAKLDVLMKVKTALRALGEARTAVKRHNNKLERLVRERTKEIVATRDMTVFALAHLAESRDPETGAHLERIRAYAQILAEDLSRSGPYASVIDEPFLEDLYRACPLHDIGKVGIPDVILLKPGKLTDEEFEVMKKHTVIGADAIEHAMQESGCAGFLELASEVARCHHERFDGSGYPGGLSGQDIPLAARIVALPDMFDALTSVRVYKKAFEPDVARDMIIDERGSHFDPVIVDAFERNFDQFLDVYGKFRDEESSSLAEDSTMIREVIGL